MNPSPFQQCCAFVIDIEGGDQLVHHPKDPGGLTRYGICQKSFPLVNVAKLTRAEAEALYEHNYWNLAGCPGLPPPLALMHFDAAVNQGIVAASTMLQYTLKVPADGQIGPKTLAAAQRGSARAHAIEYAARRMHRYAATRNWDAFGLGWSRRLMACLAHALTLGEPT